VADQHQTEQEQIASEVITEQPAQALAGLFDIAAPADALPPFWHWVYLLERPGQSALAPDGHPKAGVPTPPAPGLARMFAGGATTTHRLLRFGEPAQRRTWVADRQDKDGRSGPLTFLTVRSEVTQGGELAIVDEQNLVYRERTPLPAAEPAAADIPAGDWGFEIDELVLFRFSALTYNSHRIHYDREFALAEGHRDLVVHGPLQAMLMAEQVRRSGRSLVGSTLRYRLVKPVYGAQRLTLHAVGPDGVEVRDGAGRVTATASVETAE